MPKKAEATEPEAKPVEAASEAEKEQPRGAKTAAIKAALKSHKNASPKEIAELLTAQGIETTAAQVSNVKFLLSRKKKAKSAPHPPPNPPPLPPSPKMPCRSACCKKRRNWRRNSAASRKPRRRLMRGRS